MDTLPAATHIDLRCFPSADEEFTEHVYGTAARFRHPPTPTDLEDRVQVQYPGATVHLRSALAVYGPEDTVWYVFRDGRR